MSRGRMGARGSSAGRASFINTTSLLAASWRSALTAGTGTAGVQRIEQVTLVRWGMLT